MAKAGARRIVGVETKLRKGLPFGSPTLCTDDARVEKRWHYCFWTKDPKSSSLIAGWRMACADIAIAIAAVC